MLVADFPRTVEEVERGPVVVVERAPDREVVVDRDRVVDAHFLRRATNVAQVVLERKLRAVDADHDQALGLVLLGPRADVWKRAQPVDARVCPDVDEDDLAVQTLRREWRRVEPGGRRPKRGQLAFTGQGTQRVCCRSHKRAVEAKSSGGQPQGSGAQQAPTFEIDRGWHDSLHRGDSTGSGESVPLHNGIGSGYSVRHRFGRSIPSCYWADSRLSGNLRLYSRRNRDEQSGRDGAKNGSRRARRRLLLGRRGHPARCRRRDRHRGWVYRWLVEEPALRRHARQPVGPRRGGPRDVRPDRAEL